MRSLLALVALVFSVSVFAADCQLYQVSPDKAWHTSKSAACTSVVGVLAANNPTSKFAVQSQDNDYCTIKATNNLGQSSVTSYGYQTKVGPCPDVCADKVGKSEIVNTTSGWKRTPAVADSGEEWVVTYRLPPSGVAKICGGGAVCEQTIDANEPCSECGAYVSQEPGANGLYRVSTDFRGHFTGKACTASSTSDLPAEALHKDDNKDPPCPGYVGEVNGKRGCFGTADKPVRSVPPPPKPPGITGIDAGNPAAGAKPSSGEGSGTGGSGRTPSIGTGGSAGGPAGAAAGSTGGTKPDGTTDKPTEGKEQAACGAPGQPKCGIDESGTPGAYEGDKAALDGWKSQVEANRGQIKDSGGGTFDSFNVFFSAPPLVACEAIDLPNEQRITRHCDVVEGTRNVMAYIWALSALWLGLGWIREAI